MGRKYLLLFFLGVISLGYSQGKMTAQQVLNKAKEVYKNQNYLTYNSKYTLYLDYKTTTPYEQYNGFLVKKNNVDYVKIKNTEFVSFGDYGLKINHDQKALVMEDAPNNFEGSPMDLSNYMKGFDAKLKEDNNFYICELSPSKITQVMVSKLVIYIRKQDFSIAKEVMYLVESMESLDAKGKVVTSVPRLEIEFVPRTKNTAKDDLLVNRTNYFTGKGKNITVSKRFSAYKIYKSF